MTDLTVYTRKALGGTQMPTDYFSDELLAAVDSDGSVGAECPCCGRRMVIACEGIDLDPEGLDWILADPLDNRP